ncbi:MAG: Uma2 family endonuclease [Rhodothermales bacterium]|jgi:Uma2 family endonuclease
MQSVVSAPTPDLKPHRFTIEDYLAMGSAGILDPEDRVELVDGQVVAMSPIGNWHSTSVRRLARIFLAQVPEAVLVDVQNGLDIGVHTQVVPDLMLIPVAFSAWDKPVRGQDVLLVVEVAESSIASDRTIKARLYATAGVPEYWVVDLTGRAVEAFRDPREGSYRSRTVYTSGDVVQAEMVAGIAIPVAEVVPPRDAG